MTRVCQPFRVLAGRERQLPIVGKVGHHALGQAGGGHFNRLLGEQALMATFELYGTLLLGDAARRTACPDGVRDHGGGRLAIFQLRDALIEELETQVVMSRDDDVRVVEPTAQRVLCGGNRHDEYPGQGDQGNTPFRECQRCNHVSSFALETNRSLLLPPTAFNRRTIGDPDPGCATKEGNMAVTI